MTLKWSVYSTVTGSRLYFASRRIASGSRERAPDDTLTYTRLLCGGPTIADGIADMTPPEGFALLPLREGFIDHNGPYYWRRDEHGVTEYGFQSDVRHANPYGFLHGGAVLGFLDTILGSAVFAVTKRKCATVSLDSRFVGGVAPGPWITGRPTIKKVTRTFVFADAEAFADDKLLVTAAAVFRVFDA